MHVAASNPDPSAESTPAPARPLTLYVVSHTHWDREWYLPFQAFRMKLVRLVDKLLAILAAEPSYKHYMLDGQTVVLEDYLEVRPDRAAALQEHIRRGRVLVGPWYVMPDEFLVGGEALIRNFLRGRRISGAFGGGMPVGYTPDPFGHIGQMPQILRGFGINWAVFWRGIDADIRKTEFWWQAPDGSTVLATRLPHGYSNGLPLSFSISAARNQAAWLREVEGPQCTTPALLVLNGDDHMEPSADTPEILDELSAELAKSGVGVVHATLPQYHAAVLEHLGPAGTPPAPDAAAGGDGALPLHRGEFRSAAHTFLLPGVLSTRTWIKQANYAAETLLERWVEPWEALYWATNVAYGSDDDWERALQTNSAAALRDTAWKYLLLNQPHDSICGCSADAVHDEMKTRFAHVEQLGGELRDQALRGLAAFVDTRAGEAAQAVIVFNPLGSPRTDVVQATVEVTASVEEFRLIDADGTEVPYEVVERKTEQLASFELDPLALETALSMAPDGRVLGMVVLDIHLHRSDEPGIVACDITVAEKGEPNLAAVQAAGDVARRLVEGGQVRLFQLRGHHPGHVVARFVARDVPGLGYRTFAVLPGETGLDTEEEEDLAETAAGETAVETAGAPNPATLYQAEGEAPADLPEAQPDGGVVHPAVMTIPDEPAAAEYVLENSFLRVSVDPGTGALTLADRRAGVVVSRGNVFVNSGDAGDTYNYSPPPQDRAITGYDRPPRIAKREDALGGRIVIEGDLALPAWLSEDRQSRSSALARCAVRTTIQVVEGVPRVDIQTSIDNRAGDHRLRVVFEVPVQTETSDAEGSFDVVRRPAGPLPGSESWSERAVATYPQRTFVAAGDGQRGLLLANRGLPEFEVRPTDDGTEIALTLLRSVGWLSRADLATRPGHAGPGLATPGAQGFGVHTFEYALVPFAESWLTSGAFREAHSFAVPLHAVVDAIHDGPLPGSAGMIAVAPPEFVISALKRSEDGTDLILRGWNIAEAPVAVHLALPPFVRAARRVRLDEQDAEAPGAGGPVHWTGGAKPAVDFVAAPREIVTLRLEL